ncbi:hypothetical protein AruPA_19960 [Acidiphilium sp. PA]|uniref:hypothetical protein n=1 Tax=Acidiphilium sp. PA TaxID=2871705 RepID=UPI0022436B9B|nr:hypothetical protein [Acidiphilium sp. PA]MCW8309305.1 hypothetical protein [Acidiphilium sp. PA]
MFDLLYQIGEIAGILRDIAAREISENKPIAGTAIDLLARLIIEQVEKGVEFTPDGPVDAPDPKPGGAALISGHDYTAPSDAAWPGGLDLRGLHAALSGTVTVLCGLQSVADGSEIDPDAFEPALATLTPWRDRVLVARDELEAEITGK